jgi:hypothetical protein
MNRDIPTPVNRDVQLETLAAELTLAAYRVALRTRVEGTWLDLELDLWTALADTTKTWGHQGIALRASDPDHRGAAGPPARTDSR